jgi:hypothetical protein
VTKITNFCEDILIFLYAISSVAIAAKNQATALCAGFQRQSGTQSIVLQRIFQTHGTIYRQRTSTIMQPTNSHIYNQIIAANECGTNRITTPAADMGNRQQVSGDPTNSRDVLLQPPTWALGGGCHVFRAKPIAEICFACRRIGHSAVVVTYRHAQPPAYLHNLWATVSQCFATPATGHWSPATNHRPNVLLHQPLTTGHRSLTKRFATPAIGCWSPATGHSSLVTFPLAPLHRKPSARKSVGSPGLGLGAEPETLATLFHLHHVGSNSSFKRRESCQLCTTRLRTDRRTHFTVTVTVTDTVNRLRRITYR